MRINRIKRITTDWPSSANWRSTAVVMVASGIVRLIRLITSIIFLHQIIRPLGMESSRLEE